LGRTFRFVELANDVNDHMPDYVALRVSSHLNLDRKSVNGSNVLLLGLAYKPNSGDARQSPAIVVAEHLALLGATIRAVDPMVEAAYVPSYVEVVECTSEELSRADVIVVLTDHDAIDWDLVAGFGAKVVDTRNRLRDPSIDRL
jgi:UDP-N-acetyl-D-mannosaminuronic acid dehydrogenase/UDP-N-acetyl-D-glucosamine dehydrogenase